MKTLLNKDLYRVDEVVDYFGVTRKTVYLWISQGKLDAVKINGILRIPREAISNCQVCISDKDIGF